ncbi:MAG: cobalamin biosynthesis protein CbiN [Peptococcaceae bacterium BICA1-7]|nr:MAG: cobalamin biosynthesis protein CbiN [Peptococcaceae bacterium BICA1-7]HBV96672.1 energy-coupling factor ABC transporter substrate-binding protein [Desulfotomaculum sp.]
MIGPLKRKTLINLLLALLVIALAIAPLIIKGDAEFAGADGEAEKVITEVSPGYEPWYSPLWEPPSTEVESLLFALQAAAGSGFIGYYFGYQRGKKKEREKA